MPSKELLRQTMQFSSKVLFLGSGLLISVAVYWLLGTGGKGTKSKHDILSGIKVHPELQDTTTALSQKPKVIKVVDGAFVAVGFALGNCILLEGRDHVIIVDTTESIEAARDVYTEFRKITQKPVHSIIYTHHHIDHISGAKAFVENETSSGGVDIWAHESLKEMAEGGMFVGPKAYRGVVHQFGFQLDEHLVSHMRLRIDISRPTIPLFPNKFVEDEDTLEIPGLKLNLIHIPGETSDHLAVWIADKRLLLSGDNIYACFPNLYAVRGTPPRSSLAWSEAARQLRSLQAEHLVPSHGLPVSGSHEVHELLTIYMLGIRYVHDQTVRQINRGLHPDEIAKEMKLPLTLSSHPYLRQCYGTTEWSAKGTYEEYVGWFSGDPVELQPLTPRERSERFVRLVGRKVLLAEGWKAVGREEFQWALEVVSFVSRVDPSDPEARAVRLEALRGLAAEQINPTARNFYLTSALDDFRLIDWTVDQTEAIEKMDIILLLNLMRFKLKAEEVHGLDMTIVIHFIDIEACYRLHIMHSVLEVELVETERATHDPEKNNEQSNGRDRSYDAKIVTTAEVLREILSKKRSAAMAVISGDVTVEGGVTKLREFFSYFQT